MNGLRATAPRRRDHKAENASSVALSRAEENPSRPFAYKVEDAARLCGIGRTNLFGAIKDGHLKARKFNSRTLILEEDLRAWLSSLPIAPASNGESRG